jgi:pimeloyl-ACP methyl ester carboxylesterase
MRRLVSLLVALALAALIPIPAEAQPSTEYPCGDRVWPVGLGGNRPLAGSLPVLFVHGINSNSGSWNTGKRVDLVNAVTDRKPVTGWTFDYGQWSTNWVTNPHIGPALAEAITCLSRGSGHQVVVVAHSMGGLATQFAVGQRTPDTHQPVSDLVAQLITVGTPYRGSKTLSKTKQGMEATVVLDLISKVCAAWTAGGEDKCKASLSLPNTEVGTALQYDSDDIKALPPWPKDLPVLPIATDIEYFLGLRMFGAGKTYHLGDLIVTIDSQTAHANAAEPDTRTCEDASMMDMARTVLGDEKTTCYHLTQLNRPDIHRRISEVVAGLAKNPPVPRQPGPCDTVDEAALNHAHPLSNGMRYLNIDCRDRYALASANTTPPVTDNLKLTFEFTDGSWRWTGKSGTALSCGSIPPDVWRQWNQSCVPEPVSCGTVTTANGSPALVTVIAGSAECELARDIVTRYYRDAPTHGQGSGAYLQVDDWTCMSRTAGDQERDGIYGHCVRGTDTVEMSRP